MSPAAKYMMDLQRNDPILYRRTVAQKAIRNWMRHLRAAQAGKGFFREDHCLAMLTLHTGRYKETLQNEQERTSKAL